MKASIREKLSLGGGGDLAAVKSSLIGQLNLGCVRAGDLAVGSDQIKPVIVRGRSV